MTQLPPYYVLGLDMGIASCGFCLIDTENHKILEMGSHLFNAPQNPKNKASLAKERRDKRGTRRNIQRTKDRLSHILKLLKQHNLVPQEADKQWLQSARGDKPVLELRVKALDELLNEREFAQILYSLATRRGYIPHGEGAVKNLDATSTDDAEMARSCKVLKAIKENQKLFAEHNFRTIGEMLYSQERSRNRAGNYDKCILHGQLRDEIQTIFDAQRNLNNTYATKALEEVFLENFSWEKSRTSYDKTIYNQVGFCSYFNDLKRAASATLSSEMCRAYEKLGHISIKEPGKDDRRLDKRDIQKYIDILFSPQPLPKNKDCKVTYGRIRKDLDLSALAVFKGINKDDEKSKEVFEPKAFRKLRAILHDSHPEMIEKMLSDINFADNVLESLTYASTEESLELRLQELIPDITDDEISIIATIPFSSKIFKGYGSRSKKALSMLLEAFQESDIATLRESEEATGLAQMRDSKDSKQKLSILPAYEIYNPINKNPVVSRAISRARKIVNSIIKIYGVPHEIHVELARELKHSASEKSEYSKGRDANEKANKSAAEKAAKLLGKDAANISDKLQMKVRLYEEQGCKDLYTGETIDFERLVKEDYYTEIDHILPYSRTGIDGIKNKVVTLASNNQNKKERTPFEWMTSGETSAPSWNEFQARILHNDHIAQNKKNNLLREELNDEQSQKFIERNLNDTRYMSREFKSFLEDSLKFPPSKYVKQPVLVVNGATTHMLRHIWGLNFGEDAKKDRSDDRHHAVDAAVIAACSRSAIQTVIKNRFAKGKHKDKTEEKLMWGAPWDSFSSDVRAFREYIAPTRMAEHGLQGQVLEDTIYTLVSINEKDYPIIKTNAGTAAGKENPAGNTYLHEDEKSIQKLGGLAFIQLWHDPMSNKGKGKWYVDPVYYFDIPAIKKNVYTPTIAKAHTPRYKWEDVPEDALQSEPVRLYRNDIISIAGKMARFVSFNMSSVKLIYEDIQTKEPFKEMPTSTKWNNETEIKIIQEDCLGHCHRKDLHGQNS